MPNGKPAGMPCIQLDHELRCKLFGRPERPSFCIGLQPSSEMCGDDREQAIVWLTTLEHATRPTLRQELGSSISVCGMPSSR